MNLGYSVLCFLLAALFGVIAWQSKTPSISIFCGLVTVILGVTGSLLAWDWLSERVATNTAAIRDALAISPAQKLAHEIANLEPWQAELMRRYALEIELIVNVDDYPNYTLKTGGGNVPLDFIHEWYALIDWPWLPPIRTWSEGSKERNQAIALTNLMLTHQWAIEHSGNNPAKLKEFATLGFIGKRLGVL